MKTVIKIAKYLTLPGVILVTLFLWGYLTPEPKISAETNIQPAIQTVSAEQPKYGTVTIEGESMENYGIKPGDYTERLATSCEVGDICDFKCVAERCGKYKGENLTKMTVKKNGDKYWFEGRPDKYNVTKNVKKVGKELVTTTSWDVSFDSTFFGWMTEGKDVIITGVIIK